VQLPVHTQESFLAQIAGVLGIAHHAKHDVPAQPLMITYQCLEGARPSIEDGLYECVLIRPLAHLWKRPMGE
jgi:hypothetical protein